MYYAVLFLNLMSVFKKAEILFAKVSLCAKGLQIGNYFGHFDYNNYFAIILPIIFIDIVD